MDVWMRLMSFKTILNIRFITYWSTTNGMFTDTCTHALNIQLALERTNSKEANKKKRTQYTVCYDNYYDYLNYYIYEKFNSYTHKTPWIVQYLLELIVPSMSSSIL